MHGGAVSATVDDWEGDWHAEAKFHLLKQEPADFRR